MLYLYWCHWCCQVSLKNSFTCYTLLNFPATASFERILIICRVWLYHGGMDRTLYSSPYVFWVVLSQHILCSLHLVRLNGHFYDTFHNFIISQESCFHCFTAPTNSCYKPYFTAQTRYFYGVQCSFNSKIIQLNN